MSWESAGLSIAVGVIVALVSGQLAAMHERRKRVSETRLKLYETLIDHLAELVIATRNPERIDRVELRRTHIRAGGLVSVLRGKNVTKHFLHLSRNVMDVIDGHNQGFGPDDIADMVESVLRAMAHDLHFVSKDIYRR